MMIEKYLQQFDEVWGNYNAKNSTNGLDYELKQLFKQSLTDYGNEIISEAKKVMQAESPDNEYAGNHLVKSLKKLYEEIT